LNIAPDNWKVEKIGVMGPGIVGMPMAALLAHAKIKIGSDSPAKVVVVQRNSPTSGWKVGAINSGKSVIGGIEPGLDKIVSDSVAEGLLGASHDYSELSDADVILVCIQTDKDGMGPDYKPMFEGLKGLATALQNKPSDKTPLIIFESTLAPSSMCTLMKDHFSEYGLEEGQNILLGNSPNRVMPGRLVERVAESDKLIGGQNPVTTELIRKLYSNIVTKGVLLRTNSMTAEIVKTLENAYRDVRIAYAAEIVRYSDTHDIDFYQVRGEVNKRLAREDAASENPNAVPVGGLLIPTIGVGGHCLPKDGILMLWRLLEKNTETRLSLILEARMINDSSPAETIRRIEESYGEISGKSIALMGTAYRFNSEDTRNSPTLPLAQLLLEKGCRVTMHDPYVKPDDQKLHQFKLKDYFSRNMGKALCDSEIAVFCTAHQNYSEDRKMMLQLAPQLKGVFDGCNLYKKTDFNESQIEYAGIGRGAKTPPPDFIDFVHGGFRTMERGVANEVQAFVDFANEHYAKDDFNRVDFKEVQRIAGTCVTGCDIVDPCTIDDLPEYNGFVPRLVQCAKAADAHKMN
jgi:UDP-N-acetyl-D-mannosaminuronic acid dehydrogenase